MMSRKRSAEVLAPQVKNSVENWLVDALQGTFQLVHNFEMGRNIGLEYKPEDGFYANKVKTGKRVRQLPDFNAGATATLTDAQDLSWWMAVANAMATLPEPVNTRSEACPFSVEAEIMREALINDWLKYNDFSLESACRIDENHWIPKLVRHLKTRSEHQAKKQKVVGFFFTATYEEIVQHGAMGGVSLDQIRAYVNNPPSFFLLRWFHYWVCRIWDYHEVVRYKAENDALESFSTRLDDSTKEIVSEVPQRTRMGFQSYKDHVVPKFFEAVAMAEAEALSDMQHDTGFSYIQSMFKLMLDTQKNRLLRELNQQGEGFAELREEVITRYAQFEQRWDILTDDTYRQALMNFQAALDGELAKISQMECTIKQTEQGIGPDFAVFSQVEAAISELQLKLDANHKIPDYVVEFIEALRSDYRAKFEEACQQCIGEAKKWQQQEVVLLEKCRNIFNKVVPTILGIEDDRFEELDTVTKLAWLADETSKIATEIYDVSDIDALNTYTGSFVAWRRQYVLDQFSAIAFKVRDLVAAYPEIEAYRERAEGIISTMKANINTENVYTQAMHALAKNTIERHLAEGEDDGIANEIEYIRKTIHESAVQACERFGPKFVADFHKFRRDLHTLLTGLSEPKQFNSDICSITTRKRDLIETYTPRADEMGTYAGQFLQARVKSVEDKYAQWVKLCAEETPAGMLFAGFYQRELAGIVRLQERDDAYQATCYERLHQCFVRINREQNPKDDPSHMSLLLMLQNHYTKELEMRFKERWAEINRGQIENSAIKALIQYRSPSKRNTAKVKEFLKGLVTPTSSPVNSPTKVFQ